jgi:uncharacterized membrane protein YecN with MAPEG domain
MLNIVPLYAALLTFLYVGLSVRTIRKRRELKINIGDAQNPEMLRAMRVHSNFSEYAPLAIVLFAFIEVNDGPNALLHGLGSAFLLGRISHIYGVSQVQEKFTYRIFGMMLTFSSLMIAALYLFVSNLGL